MSIHQLAAKKRAPRTLVPILPGADNESLIELAQLLCEGEPILLLGVVPIAPDQSLSTGAPIARELREFIQSKCDRVNILAKPRIRVSYKPWEDIQAVLRNENKIRLMLLDYEISLPSLQLTASDILREPPCNTAIVRGPIPSNPKSVMVPMRGGPHAEHALKLGLSISKPCNADLKVVRIAPELGADAEAEAFESMARILQEMPSITHDTLKSADAGATILESSNAADLVVMGTSAHPRNRNNSFGDIPDALFKDSKAAVVAIKTKQRVPDQADKTRFGTGAISVLVDQWFAENTFHADEFDDLTRLAELKKQRGETVSLALPTLNEEKTLGKILEIVCHTLRDEYGLIDEVVVIDSNSTDSTRDIARSFGVPVYIHQELLPEHGARPGKGEALWKSLHVTSGDIILWVDTDISNFHGRFVYGLLGPLLQQKNLLLSKGFYKRPLKTGNKLESGRGGRVTELTARPLFNLFYPELSGIIQPLSGEYGGRRSALEQLTFTSGYGVETCILIDMLTKFSLSSIAQVDMIERIHNNQSLTNLSKMSFAITQTVLSRLEHRYGLHLFEDVNRTLKIIRTEGEQYHLDVEEIAELERPPMIEVPEYRLKRGLDDKPLQETEQKVVNFSTPNGSTTSYPSRTN